ncbi:MAG: aldehyde ferredoxin oxidoreductase C-terminal domain-containing protein, partial [Smithellaceae bacterium]|nr:aldehyde ferredoxin oxidoreductase C-terminal domain-containing protein [Smithellaceae bacterium]
QLLDPRGPHVGAGGSPTYFAKRPLHVFPKHLERMGVPEEARARILTDGKLDVGRLLKYSHRWFAILGSLGICARAQINRFYDAELCAALYEAATGIETDVKTLGEKADRTWELLRGANLREGKGAQFDQAPEPWLRDALFKEYLSEEPLTPAAWREMIRCYWAEQGWDEKGVPPVEK